MSNGPLVSIIINNYNYAPFLARAVDSAIQQTYPLTETIVVDDGSTDNSKEILATYCDAITMLSTPNRGQGMACLTGFRASRGDIVIFLDADDMLFPQAAESVVGVWTAGTAKVQFMLNWVDRDDAPLNQQWPKRGMPTGNMMRYIRAYGLYPSPPMSGNAFARSYLEQVLPTADMTQWRVYFDTFIIGLAPLYGEVTSISQSLGCYRLHGGNASEVSMPTLPLMRNRLRADSYLKDALIDHAARLGYTLRSERLISIPRHYRARLLSLLIDRAGHPFVNDTVPRLILHGMISAWRYPHLPMLQRILNIAAFPILPLLPGRWLDKHFSFLLDARLRPRWLAPRWPGADRNCHGSSHLRIP